MMIPLLPEVLTMTRSKLFDGEITVADVAVPDFQATVLVPLMPDIADMSKIHMPAALGRVIVTAAVMVTGLIVMTGNKYWPAVRVVLPEAAMVAFVDCNPQPLPLKVSSVVPPNWMLTGPLVPDESIPLDRFNAPPTPATAVDGCAAIVNDDAVPVVLA